MSIKKQLKEAIDKLSQDNPNIDLSQLKKIAEEFEQPKLSLSDERQIYHLMFMSSEELDSLKKEKNSPEWDRLVEKAKEFQKENLEVQNSYNQNIN